MRGGNVPSVRIAGTEEIVFDWSSDACGATDIPDLPARAFRDNRGRIHLTISHFVNRRMTGRGFDRLRHDCAITMSSDRDPNPSKFNDREWIAALHSSDGRIVHALVHNEYQGHRHPGRCPSGEYLRCWYNAVTMAVSRDAGASYDDIASAPRHLVAALPYRYRPDGGPIGVFSPTNIVRNPRDGYYYAFVRAASSRDESRACLLRTRTLTDPRAWRAWDGDGFDMHFQSPYSGTVDTRSRALCAPVARRQIQDMSSSLVWVETREQFLLVGVGGADVPGQGVVWGIYYAVSDDLLHWSPRRLLLEATLASRFRYGVKTAVAYPSVIDHESRSRSFETVDGKAYLYFTRFNYESCEQTFDRDLVRVPIEIR